MDKGLLSVRQLVILDFYFVTGLLALSEDACSDPSIQ